MSFGRGISWLGSPVDAKMVVCYVMPIIFRVAYDSNRVVGNHTIGIVCHENAARAVPANGVYSLDGTNDRIRHVPGPTRPSRRSGGVRGTRLPHLAPRVRAPLPGDRRFASGGRPFARDAAHRFSHAQATCAARQ